MKDTKLLAEQSKIISREVQESNYVYKFPNE